MQEMIDHCIRQMRERGIVFEQGLGRQETVLIERKFGICFPPDLKSFLQTAIPVSERFVNWRAGLNSAEEEKKIVSRIQWPWDGLAFDLRHDGYWCEAWGDKPDSPEQRILVAEKHFGDYPVLIPIFAHRYIPERPCEPDNPIFSVYQMDVIYYGNNLADYFAREFEWRLPPSVTVPAEPKHIEFWGDCM